MEFKCMPKRCIDDYKDGVGTIIVVVSTFIIYFMVRIFYMNIHTIEHKFFLKYGYENFQKIDAVMLYLVPIIVIVIFCTLVAFLLCFSITHHFKNKYGRKIVSLGQQIKIYQLEKDKNTKQPVKKLVRKVNYDEIETVKIHYFKTLRLSKSREEGVVFILLCPKGVDADKYRKFKEVIKDKRVIAIGYSSVAWDVIKQKQKSGQIKAELPKINRLG